MRLRDIQNVIDENAGNLSLQVSVIPNQPSMVKIINIHKMISSINKLVLTGILRKQFDDIHSYEALYLATADTISFQKSEADELRPKLDKLRNDLITISTVVKEIVGEQESLAISVKLPKIKQLKDLKNITERLDKVFDQLLVNQSINGKVTLQAFDTGSEWFDLVFNSAKSFSIFSSVVYTVILLKREIIKNKEFEEVARNRKITNDMMENLGNQLKANYNSLMEEQSKRIMEEAGEPENNQEYLERLKFCINETSKLIDKGMQFFPSSKSSTELISKFPDFTKSDIDEMLPKMKELPNSTEQQ